VASGGRAVASGGGEQRPMAYTSTRSNACIGHGTPAMAPTQTEFRERGPGSER
jgi:hypothetical protein